MPYRTLLLFTLWTALSLRVYHANAVSLAAALSWSAVLAGFYSLLGRTARQDKVRVFYFASLALFFLLGMHLGDLAGPGEGSLQPACHLALAGDLFLTGAQQAKAFLHGTYRHDGILGTGILWLLVVLVCGGGFCSRVCFFGGVDDLFSRVLKRPVLRVPWGPHVREFQLALLLFVAYVSFAHVESEFCQWLCPFKLNDGILDASAPTHRAQVALFAVLGVLFLAVLPLLTKKRTFCSTLCPFGALPPLVQKWMPYQVKVDGGSCTSCGKCEAECPSFAIRKEGKISVITRYCTLCMRCVPVCPQGGIAPGIPGRRGPTLLDLVSMGFGGALSLFYAPAGILAVVDLLRKVLP